MGLFFMKTPQLENGYIKISNELMDAFCRYFPGFSGGQVLNAIIRKTYGWNKKEDYISISQIMELTQLARRTVIYALQDLEAKKIIFVQRERSGLLNKVNLIRFNKNYAQWVVQNSAQSVEKNRKQARVGSAKLRKFKKEQGGSAKLRKRVVQNSAKNIKSFAPTKDTIITKDNNTKDITTNVVKQSFGKEDINEVSSYFLQVMRLPTEDCSRDQSRRYWYHLLRESRTGVSGVKWLIDLAKTDDILAPNITSSKDLYYKRIKLISRKRGGRPKIAVFGGGNSE